MSPIFDPDSITNAKPMVIINKKANNKYGIGCGGGEITGATGTSIPLLIFIR
jgi:hypothetical protein